MCAAGPDWHRRPPHLEISTGKGPAPPTSQHWQRSGFRLTGYYVQPVCSPTRACFLSGRHVIHTGIYSPFGHGTVGALSRRFTLLPQYLLKLGYSPYAVGKWHLGMFN